MRPLLSHCRIAALLLALSLPLQGFAAVAFCAQPAASDLVGRQAAGAHEHCGGHVDLAPSRAISVGTEHATQNSTVHHHGCCTDCCLAAMAPANPAWTPPRADTLLLSLPQQRTPFTTSLDRLDRPPRTIPA